MRAALLAVTLAFTSAVHASEFCDVQGSVESLQHEKNEKWELFRQKKFDEVDAFFSGLVAQYEAGKISDARLARYLHSWSQPQPWVEPLVQEWVRRYPKSYAAWYALAAHYSAAGWGARGDKFVSETSEEQMAAMRSYFRKAEYVLQQADKLTKKPSLSAAMRIDMGAAAGFHDPSEVYRAAIAKWPETLEVRIQYIRKSAPKWGGSLAQLKSIIDDARSLPAADERYIRYLVLQEAGVHYDNQKQYAKAAEYYKQSVPLCVGVDNSLRYLEHAQVQLKDYDGAAQSAGEMIRRHPRDGLWWAKRAYVYQEWGRHQQAVEDYRRAIELGNPDASFNLGFYYENGVAVKRDPQRAMDLYLTADRLGVKGARAQAEKLSKSSGIPLR